MPLRLPRRPLARRTFAACAIGTLSLALCGTNVAVAHLVVMHGYADYTSALLWIQAEGPGPIHVRWRSDHDGLAHELTLDARTANDDVVVARLTGLAPGTRATYAIDVDLGRMLGMVIRGPLVDLLRGQLAGARAGELKKHAEG